MSIIPIITQLTKTLETENLYEMAAWYVIAHDFTKMCIHSCILSDNKHLLSHLLSATAFEKEFTMKRTMINHVIG